MRNISKQGTIGILFLVGVFFWVAVNSPQVSRVLQNVIKNRSFALTNPKLSRVSVRTGTDGQKEFVVNGTPIIFRGNIYIRLRYDPNNKPPTSHSVLIPGIYESNETRYAKSLALMKSYGYNSVRLLLDSYEIANKTGDGLNTAYMNNLISFLRLAENNGLYVYLNVGLIPVTGGFSPTKSTPNLETAYAKYIFDSDYTQAKAKYVKAVVQYIKQNNMQNVIMGYNIENEPYFLEDKAPLNLTSGIIHTADNHDYDMSLNSDKIKMVENNTINYVNLVSHAVKEVDGQALITAGLVSPALRDRRTDNTVMPTIRLISESNLDFIDAHVYPQESAIGETDILNAFHFNTAKKPVIMGAYGINVMKVPDVNTAAKLLQSLQINTCNKYHFLGWFAYEWDTEDSEYPPVVDDPTTGINESLKYRYYHVVEGSNGVNQPLTGKGVINFALAPKYRPDACKTDVEQTFTTTISCNNMVQNIGCFPKVGKYKINLVSDNVFSKVLFTTWNLSKSSTVAVKSWGTNVGGNTWNVVLNSADFIGSGKVQTNIWTYDAKGVSKWCNAIVLPICD